MSRRATTSQRRERFVWASALTVVAAACSGSSCLGAPRRAARWRDAPRDHDAADGRSRIAGDFARRPEDCVRGHVGRGIEAVAALARFQHRSAVGGDRRRHGAVLVARQPGGGFFTTTDGQLKRIDIDTRSLQVLGNVPLGTGGTWNQDGTILFSHLASGTTIFRISATGGEPSAVTRLGASELTHQFPQFLPDGRHFLYYTLDAKPPGVHVGQLDGAETKRLLDADSPPSLPRLGIFSFCARGRCSPKPSIRSDSS